MATKTVTKFDPAALEMLRPKIVAALETLKDLGLAFVVGRMTFDEHQFSTKLTVTLASVDIPREDYKKQCQFYGLLPEWLDQTFTDGNGNIFTVVGLNSAKRTQPVILMARDGKTHFANVTFIKTNLMPAKALLAEGKKNWNDAMKVGEWARGKLHNSDPVYRLKAEWLGRTLGASKYTIVGLINSDPASALVREGDREGDGRFETFDVTQVLYGMDAEAAAAYEYEVRCVQDEWSADGLRKEWLGKDFVFAGKTFKLIGLDSKQKNIIMKAGDELQAASITDIRKALQKQHPVVAKGAAVGKAHKRDPLARKSA
jgi:hypothetical protein